MLPADPKKRPKCPNCGSRLRVKPCRRTIPIPKFQCLTCLKQRGPEDSEWTNVQLMMCEWDEEQEPAGSPAGERGPGCGPRRAGEGRDAGLGGRADYSVAPAAGYGHRSDARRRPTVSNWKMVLQDRLAAGQELLARDKADPQRCCAQVRHYIGKAMPSYLRCRKRARNGRLTCWCHRQMESEDETQ
jgi:hypothetical protein